MFNVVAAGKWLSGLAKPETVMDFVAQSATRRDSGRVAHANRRRFPPKRNQQALGATY